MIKILPFAVKFATVIAFLLLVVRTNCLHAQDVGKRSSKQLEALQVIDKRAHELTAWSDSIWKFAEPSFKEIRSTKLLVDVLKKEGFNVQENRDDIHRSFYRSQRHDPGLESIGINYYRVC